MTSSTPQTPHDFIDGDAGRSAAGTSTQPASDNVLTQSSPPADEYRESRVFRIARRAHEIYEERGGTHGADLDDWLQAEREVDAEAAALHRARHTG
jgi:hypothetical protein